MFFDKSGANANHSWVGFDWLDGLEWWLSIQHTLSRLLILREQGSESPTFQHHLVSFCNIAQRQETHISPVPQHATQVIMRLVNTETLRLESFVVNTPLYAILSHTWDEEEILFDDLYEASSLPTAKKGWQKVSRSCARAKQDGYEYIWIDTCCIDRGSSAELSESINAMFYWHHNAQICYAYLSDHKYEDSRDSPSNILKSRWFTRGWTLQELIAPDVVLFVDAQWNDIGKKDEEPWCDVLSQGTSIPQTILRRKKERYCYPCSRSKLNGESRGNQCIFCNTHNVELLSKHLRNVSVYDRMRWARLRVTTRPEDEAYCLIGIFDVNMPLLYGEGNKAFERLQKEIMLKSNDQSILVNRMPSAGILATTALHFDPPYANMRSILPPQQSYSSLQKKSYMRPTSDSIEVGLFLCPLQKIDEDEPSLGDKTLLSVGILNCTFEDKVTRPGLLLRALTKEGNHYESYGVRTEASPSRFSKGSESGIEYQKMTLPPTFADRSKQKSELGNSRLADLSICLDWSAPFDTNS